MGLEETLVPREAVMIWLLAGYMGAVSIIEFSFSIKV